MHDMYDLLLISIHSLVNRETGLPASAVDRQDYFNPLPRKEGDG